MTDLTAAVSTDLLLSELERVRRRTLGLLDPLPVEDQVAQHSPLMSPLVWDLAHVGNYEDQWLDRALGGAAPDHPEYDGLYDAFRHPRADRPTLPLLGPDGARAYIADVRARVVDRLGRLDPAGFAVPGRFGDGDGLDPLLRHGFVHGMVIQHEHQHDETMLATLQLMGEHATAPAGTVPSPTAAVTGSVAAPDRRDGRGARRHVPPGYRYRAVGLRQRASAAPGGRGPVPHRSSAGHERPLPRLPGRRRLRPSRTVVAGGLGLAQRGCAERPAVLVTR